MPRARRIAACAAAALLAACGSDDGSDEPDPVVDAETRRLLESLSPEVLPPAPPDISNAWADDPDAARFGQRLFFDPSFSGKLLDGDNDGSENALGNQGETGRVSCAGCHIPEAGFSDDRSLRNEVSLAAGWGIRKTPSLLDVAQSPLLMWDGRHDSLYNQPFGVFESEVEANSSRLFVARSVFDAHAAEYERIFGPLPPLDDAARFPELAAEETGCQRLDSNRACTTVMRGLPGDGAEYDSMAPEDQSAVTRVVVNIGKALGAYQRLLTCGPSRFDRFMHGESDALTITEQRGAALFVGKGRCIECHSGPFMSDEKFHNVGLKPEIVATVFIDAGDRGAIVGLQMANSDPLNVTGEFSDGDDDRLPESVGPELEGAFKTPRLRCVGGRPSFMHTAHMATLEEVIAFFDRGGDSVGYPGVNELEPLGLTEVERSDLIAFLRALDGPGPDSALLAPPP